jgi:DNA integrity scanning protein DisA with diadenylate cyclase activity
MEKAIEELKNSAPNVATTILKRVLMEAETKNALIPKEVQKILYYHASNETQDQELVPCFRYIFKEKATKQQIRLLSRLFEHIKYILFNSA